MLKDVYEALRAGPGWGRTLLLVMYDDAGGWYDHVVPPSEGVPNDEAPCGCGALGAAGPSAVGPAVSLGLEIGIFPDLF